MDFSKVSGRILTAGEMNAHNTFENPSSVKTEPFYGFRQEKGQD